jgi:hypothetical protein
MANRKQKSELSRRNFMGKAALLGVGLTILPRHVFGRGYIPPSETVNHVLIGCGGISHEHTNACAGPLHRWIAVCDVDANRMNGRANELKGANGGQLPLTAKDYREVIGLADADIVHVCTPPHIGRPLRHPLAARDPRLGLLRGYCALADEKTEARQILGARPRFVCGAVKL